MYSIFFRRREKTHVCRYQNTRMNIIDAHGLYHISSSQYWFASSGDASVVNKIERISIRVCAF